MPTPRQFVEAALAKVSAELGPENVEKHETLCENLVSASERGAWVEVWVWVDKDEAAAQPEDEDE